MTSIMLSSWISQHLSSYKKVFPLIDQMSAESKEFLVITSMGITRKNLMKIAIAIALLNMPSLLLFAESGNEVMGLAVIAIESCSLAIMMLIARYIWRFMSTEEVGGKR
jgi:hypothetical protein